MAGTKTEWPGGKGLWIALGGGCTVLALCLLCGGGSLGIWWWNRPAGGTKGERGDGTQGGPPSAFQIEYSVEDSFYQTTLRITIKNEPNTPRNFFLELTSPSGESRRLDHTIASGVRCHASTEIREPGRFVLK